MNIAIVGSRDYPAPEKVRSYVGGLSVQPSPPTIVSGGARGVDSLAEEVAEEYGMETLIFPADWERHGKSAGFIRNREIVKAADLVVAFWNGSSRGTRHTLKLAHKFRVDTEIIYP